MVATNQLPYAEGHHEVPGSRCPPRARLKRLGAAPSPPHFANLRAGSRAQMKRASIRSAVIGVVVRRHQSPAALRATRRSGAPTSPAVVLSARLDQYYDRLRLPPGTQLTCPVWPVIEPAAPGRGVSPQFPPSLSERSEPHTPGSPSAPASPGSRTPSMAFDGALISGARHSLHPHEAGPLTTPQASLDATDRSVAPPYRAFDAGLRPDPFPDRVASLLPGLLAATRTGLPPASDDELTTRDQLHRPPPVCWAHESAGLAGQRRAARRPVPP
jgi:hypothetical protein